MGRGRRGGPTTAARVTAAEKRRKALELRKAGATYEQIAQEVGFAHKGNAHRAVAEAIASIPRADAEELVAITTARFDALILGLWPKARAGDTAAAREVLRVERDRARLLGLNDVDARMAAVAEGRLQLDEQTAVAIWTVIARVLDALGLTAEQEAIAAREVPAQLRLVSAGELDPEKGAAS